MRARGFTILEIIVVMTIFGIVSLVALPSIRAIAARKTEIEAAGDTHAGINLARDTAYKQLDCVEVKVVGDDLVFEQFGCATPDAGPAVEVGRVTYDRTAIGRPDIQGSTSPIIFQPNGGLQDTSGPRYVELPMRSGRKATFEIQPAIGSVRECRTYSPGPPVECVE